MLKTEPLSLSSGEIMMESGINQIDLSNLISNDNCE